jgi:integrase
MGHPEPARDINPPDFPQASTRIATVSPLPGTDLPQSERTRKLNATLPKGIVIGEWPNRRRPYFVRFGAARTMESFESERVRNDRADALLLDQQNNGKAAYAFDPKEWRAYVAFKERTGATLPQLEDAWAKFKGSTAKGATVSQLIALYRTKRTTKGRSKDALKHRDLALSRFEAFAGLFASSSVNEDVFTGWFRQLETDHKLGDVAIAGHFSAVRTMFNLPAVRRLCRDNPCDYVEAPAVEESDEVAVLTLRQAFDFFKANRNQSCVGKLAAEAFAGLRFSSAARLKLANLDFAELGLELPGSQHKSKRRHYVDGFPKNLWRWLRFAPPECWELSERNYMRLKSEAFIRAQFPNPGNVLRHTMPTMHLSAFKDAASLATLLQHRNATMLYQRYKGRGVPRAVGRAYFMITPKTVQLTFERFCALVGVQSPTP